MAGGTTTYVALGLNSMLQDNTEASRDVDFHLVASLAKDDMDIVAEMRRQGITVDVIPSRATSFFENIYGIDNSDRSQRVRSTGDPFSIDVLKPLLEPLRLLSEKPYIILGSLLADDFPLDVVQYCNTIGKVVMDAQGYFREVRFAKAEDGSSIGKVYECDWKDKDKYLANIEVLKLNENEARLITNETDLHLAAKLLHEQGIPEVLLTLGRMGSIIAAEGEVIDIPVIPEKISIDATGCGDTYVMAYIYRRSQGDSPRQAALFASSAATLKLEGNGPLKASESEVRERTCIG